MSFLTKIVLTHQLVLAVMGGRRASPMRPKATFPEDEVLTVSRRRNIDDMACDYFLQPLNHFALPKGSSPTYKQRYCIFNEFVVNPKNATVFFYTGNESPLEEYINNTGLMWELAPTFNAQVVFVEHRYEGSSKPEPNITSCLAYSSSIQALADFASFLERHLLADRGSELLLQSRPVIAFGGSYGGMLTAWMRMKYPNLIAGGIAGSAPIWGFPSNFPTKIDTAWRVIHRGLELPYPPTSNSSVEENRCSTNLLAAWSLIQFLGTFDEGRRLLTESFLLCSSLRQDKVSDLINWAQTPWFDLAEGSFPYPSSYIPFALTHRDNVTLPAWPLQAACWKESDLYKDLGIRISGNMTDVRYNVNYSGTNITLSVDWDTVTRRGGGDSISASDLKAVAPILVNVRKAVSIWYNMTKDLSCFELSPAPNLRRDDEANATKDCQEKMDEWGSWLPLCCNEEMDLIITEAQGLGNDFLWPPSYPRGTKNHADVVAFEDTNASYCTDPNGRYGFPQQPADSWSTWYDTVYGGTRILAHSNILFSNGLLDPWSAAGVYQVDPTVHPLPKKQMVVPGLYLQHLNNNGLVSLILEYGGHHTDLMYSSKRDPESITVARSIEKAFIAKWIQEWWEGMEEQDVNTLPNKDTFAKQYNGYNFTTSLLR